MVQHLGWSPESFRAEDLNLEGDAGLTANVVVIMFEVEDALASRPVLYILPGSSICHKIEVLWFIQ